MSKQTQTKPGVEEMNRVIAEFDGLKEKIVLGIEWWIREDNQPRYRGPLLYHESWDWLMPVVEKIEKLGNRRFGFSIEPLSVTVTDNAGIDNIVDLIYFPDEKDTKLSMCHLAVYDFIIWHNAYINSTTPTEGAK